MQAGTHTPAPARVAVGQGLGALRHRLTAAAAMLALGLFLGLGGISAAQAAMPDDCVHLAGEQEVDVVIGAGQDFQACFSLSGDSSERPVTVYTFSGLQYGHKAAAYGFQPDTDEVELLAESSTAESDVTELSFPQAAAGSYFTIGLPGDAGTDFHVDVGHIPMTDEVKVYIEIRPKD